MKIYTNDQIRAIEAATIRSGVSSLELIERFASGVAREVEGKIKKGQRVIVFAGPLKNGAQALSLSRQLMSKGITLEIYLFNIGGNRLSPDCKTCRDRLVQEGEVNFTEVVKDFVSPQFTQDDVVIDGMFGSELDSPIPSNGYVSVIHMINDSSATVISLDLPSGMCGDWNTDAINRNIIHATYTYTPQFPRLMFFLPDSAELLGEWKIIDIGLSRDEMRRQKPQFYLLQQQDVRPLLRPRPEFVSKADLGSAVIFAGSYGMMGAAVLAARGALRSGVGKVTLNSPRCGYVVIQSAVPSALYKPASGELVIEDFALSHNYDAVAVGPGIGTSETTVKALEQFLKVANANRRSLVLDADALNCISIRPTMLNFLPVMSVITPHAAEFDRMFGECATAEIRLRRAIEVASYHQIMIVLKGHYTAIVRPDGIVIFNSSGTPALATAGSGDVLTGIITSLVAQGHKPEIAAFLGCFIHGIAGQISAERNGDYGVTAEDIASNVGRAIKMIMS